MRVVAVGFPPDVGLSAPDPDDPRLAMPEMALHAAVEELAAHLKWQTYHTYDSRRSKGGFPDLVLWRNRLLFVEPKSTKGTLRRDQLIPPHGLAAAFKVCHG